MTQIAAARNICNCCTPDLKKNPGAVAGLPTAYPIADDHGFLQGIHLCGGCLAQLAMVLARRVSMGTRRSVADILGDQVDYQTQLHGNTPGRT
jgi:hypothetical protein